MHHGCFWKAAWIGLHFCVLDLELVSQFSDILGGISGVSLYLAFVLLYHYVFQLEGAHSFAAGTHFVSLDWLAAERTVGEGQLFLEAGFANEVLLHADHHGPAGVVGEELDAD